MHELPAKTKESGGKIGQIVLSFGEVAVQGRRWEMEDAHIVIPDFGGDGEFFAGIYDGHNGRAVADFAQILLHKNLKRALSRKMPPEEALIEAFIATDKRIKRERIRGGSTAVVTYFKDGMLYVANAGDARAVLDRSGKAIRLSHDHKADDPQEIERIEALGSRVDYDDVPYGGIPRVEGFAISRSLGDHETNGIITAEPFISATRFKKGDRFLILACDGIWDVLSDQQAVTLIHGLGNSQKAAETLKDEALKRRSKDNISVVVLRLNSTTFPKA